MSKSYQKTLLILGAILVVSMFIPFESFSQCPMCKIAAESNLKDGGTAGAGLNAGILYMLAAPYLLVGTIGFIWWKNHKKIEK